MEHSDPPPPRTFDASSRTSSSSSSSSTSSSLSNANLVGHLEHASIFRPIIFNATATAAHGDDSSAVETPPDSRPESDHEFDDHRLPARADRRSSFPGLAGNDAGSLSDPRRKSAADGLLVSLERIPAEKGETGRRYVLKIDDEIRELLAAGARERVWGRKDEKDGGRRRRRRFGDLVFVERFTMFDSMNPESAKSPFHGFYVLIWLGVALFMIKTAAENYRITGRIFDVDILSIMFQPTHLFDCLFADAIMFYGSTFWNVPLQRAVMSGVISWNKSGWILQALWEAAYLYLIVSYTLYREWPWIQTVFLVLHCIVILMKQHSYSFYNGYLSEVSKRRKVLEDKLAHLEDAGATTTGADFLGVDSLRDRRRSSVGLLDISQFPDELDPRQASRFASLVRAEIEACDAELSLEATNSPRVTYPENLTFSNYLEYIHFPTLVYELAYPRTRSINWSYVAEKTAATFGVLGIMIVVSQHFMYPVVIHCHSLRSLPLSARLAEFPWILLKLVFPFMGEYLCVWYLIWELILNLLGELTRFADRGFASDWWNATTWDAFARDWNKPVHNFLLRHVYHSSISTFQISRETATLITFLISAAVHELVMWCIFGKLRGYLLLAQMFQLPLVSLSRTRLMRDRKTLGNVLFWIGIWTGPSFLSASYLIL